MSLLNGSAAKAREVLDYCLSSESPEVRSKVYEIVNSSGLEPDDPLFLVLVLTGQMRVLLEAAPEQLNQLLINWKQESASSLAEIMSAVSLIKQTQQEQADVIKGELLNVSQQCVSDIKRAGMATTSAIADANSETWSQVQQTQRQNEKLFESVKRLEAKIEADTQRNTENMIALMEWVNKTTQRQETVNQQTTNSLAEIGKIQRNKVWLRIADAFWSLPALVALGLIWIGGTWMIASKKYNSPNTVFGRNLVEWNIDRLNHCYDTDNPKCTVWIVSPDSPKREGAE
jgi:hypothetical protein